MARLFVAIWPPEEVGEELRALHRKDQRGVRFVPPENWHVTLRFLGDSDPDAVTAALDGGTYPGTQARLGPAVDVLAERALVVPVHGVDELAATVARRTAALGDPVRRRFAGHLTVARIARSARRLAMPRALGTPIEAAFDVPEIALVQSRLDPAGARYETLATWPLERRL